MSDQKKLVDAFHIGPKGIREVDPSFQGTGADRRKFMKTGKPQTQVAHAYLGESSPEEVVMASSGGHRHKLKVDLSKLYDITKDELGHMATAEKDMATGNYQGNPIDAQDLARTRIKDAGFHGLHRRSGASQHGSVELFHKTPVMDEAVNKEIEENQKKIVGDPEKLAQGGNVGEQRKKVFGTSSAPPKGSEMQEKHMEHIKRFAKQFLGLDLKPSGGKIDKATGERREENPEIGVDKPDWRSGSLESQWNPDAAIHELAHLMLLPRGVSLKEGQELMDQQYTDVQKKYGYMKQKQSAGEVQPMAAEQLIRRYLGMPANKNSVPVENNDPEMPLRTSVEDPTEVIGTRVQNKKSGKWVDLIRQSRFLTPENKERIEKVLSGQIKFHHEKGWEDNPEAMGAKVKAYKEQLSAPPDKGNDSIRRVADEYAKEKGIKLKHGEPAIDVDPERAKKIAKAYEEMEHKPNNKKVKAAYDALIGETLDQFQHIKNSGLKISKIEEGQENPYKSSKDLIKDITQNNHMWFYPTEQGFGSKESEDKHAHPLMAPTAEKIGNHRMLANDVFRVVHDYFGHVKEGHGFGHTGEENAWKIHKQMYSPEAQKALTSETRGQNSWVNFGPHGESNRKNPSKTVYAEQKAGLLPDWVTKEENLPKRKMADGGEVMMADGGDVGLPEGFQLEPGQQVQMPGMEPSSAPPQGFQLEEEKYGTPGQMALTGLEGLAHGVAGPLATLAETKLLGVPEHEILGRQRENPITHGIGQGAGLVGGALTGVGEAALVAKAGQAAAKGLGLAGAEALLPRIGSSVVANAVEMGILQGSDEVSKLILNDPETSTQTAIANVGLASALGGVGGGLMTGVVSPLWKATAGPKVNQALNQIKSHLNGTGKLDIPEAVLNAERELGIELPPALRSAFSGNPKAQVLFNELRETQHPEIIKQLRDLQENSHKAVLDSLGLPLESVQHYSENEAGHDLLNTFKREYEAKYGPIAQKLEARDALAKHIHVPDEQRLDRYGKIIEAGMEAVGTDSPYYKLYENYGQRLLAKDTIGGMDQLKTELFKRAKTLGLDNNEKDALHQIRNLINDFQENQILRSTKQLEKEGMEYGAAIGRDIVAERAAANKEYAQFSKLSQELSDHLGVGDFRGEGTLRGKLTDKIAPEDLLKKFSPKGNADIIPFLQQHFPETLAQVQANESKRFLRPHVGTDMGEPALNIKGLSKAVERGMAGAPEHTRLAMPETAMRKLEAAKVLQDAIPDFKSSGTAGWLSKLTKHIPSSAMPMLSMLLGHNPIMGYVLGEIGQRMGKDAPEAIKLAMLNFLAADKPIKAEGFKATVDFMHNVIKGEAMLNKSVEGVFKTGIKGLPDFKVSEVARTKLDRMVAESQDNPSKQMQAASDSHLGHYMPNHQVSSAESTTRAMQYLQALKPKPFQSSPLDKKIEPTPEQEARYNRALDIANQPASVLEHVKNGTLQASDIQDLNAMYPALYKSMAQKLSDQMTRQVSDGESIPYHTRMGLSLFLGQPIDTSMNPASIQAAQPQPKMPPQQQAGMKPKPAQLKGKSNKMFQTPGQSAEMDRATRD